MLYMRLMLVSQLRLRARALSRLPNWWRQAEVTL
jgi:hypothetical protein